MKKIITILILLSPFYSFAGGWQTTTQVSEYTIEGTATGDRFHVKFAVNFNSDNCANSTTAPWKRVHGNTEQGKQLIPAILTAKAAG